MKWAEDARRRMMEKEGKRGTKVTRRIPEGEKISFTDRMHLTEEKEEEGEDPERGERGQQRKQNILQNAIGERR